MSETSCEMITRALHARDPSAMVFAGHAVMALDELRATLAARESELAEAQRRVAELEEALKLWMTYDGMGNPDPLSILLMARNATATLLRITRIPGKESDDGEMH